MIFAAWFSSAQLTPPFSLHRTAAAIMTVAGRGGAGAVEQQDTEASGGKAEGRVEGGGHECTMQPNPNQVSWAIQARPVRPSKSNEAQAKSGKKTKSKVNLADQAQGTNELSQAGKCEASQPDNTTLEERAPPRIRTERV